MSFNARIGKDYLVITPEEALKIFMLPNQNA